ncbi:hypothetical protein BC936DRAFT_150094, partial [Jimgerdemannia flammicorona]
MTGEPSTPAYATARFLHIPNKTNTLRTVHLFTRLRNYTAQSVATTRRMTLPADDSYRPFRHASIGQNKRCTNWETWYVDILVFEDENLKWSTEAV